MLHGTVLLQSAYHLYHLGILLPDSNLDADEVTTFLINDGVNCDGCLAR